MNTPEQTAMGEWDELTQQGVDIYQNRLKSMLELASNGQFVAIHVETGDHAVEHFPGGARRSVRRLHPDGPLVVIKIGPEPEHGLASRLTASRRHGSK